MNFSEFGGGAAVLATNDSGIWNATYTITAGSIESIDRNASITVMDDAGNITTTKDTTNATVDNKTPAVTSVSVPTDGTYSEGDNLDFRVNFSENINVDVGHRPYLSLTVGSQAKEAAYVSGSGTASLLFRYTVQAGDSDSDGISVNELILNGSTIKDAAGNNAILTLNSIGSTSGVLVGVVASISPTSATFDLNPNGANHREISVTLTRGSYALTAVKNGETSLTQNVNYRVDENIYTLVYEYLKTLPIGTTTITFDMDGGTDPNLEITIEDTRTALTSVTISNTTPAFGDTLSPTIVPSAATVSYSWKANGAPVGTGATYEVKADDIGKTITLTVTGTGAYKGTITSTATSAVVAKDYSISVNSTRNVVQGSGLSSLPTADSGTVKGTLSWYSNSEHTTAVVDADISTLSVGDSVTLYWSFTATTAGYVTTPKTGSCLVTIVSGAAQTLSFAESTVIKTVGDPVFTNALTHSVGTGVITYSSSNESVATVHPTSGEVVIVGEGTTTITANAAMVPGEYAPGSASFTLTVKAATKTVSVGSQIGGVTAGTAGSLTYTVTTSNIANGTYVVSVVNLPAGVTVGNNGNVEILSNSGTLTLTIADTAVAGTTDTLVLTLGGTSSEAFSIVIGEPSHFTVTFNPNGGSGSMTSETATYGVAFTLPANSFTPPTGKEFKAWAIGSADGEQVNAGATYTFTGNTTVYAVWEPIPVATYTITATAGTGGSISPSGSVTVNQGASQTFTITPNSNYSIADVIVDGTSQGKTTSYTFSDVTANHTIAATFSYNGGSGGSGGGGGSSSSGGSTSGDISTDINVTPPAADNPDSPPRWKSRFL